MRKKVFTLSMIIVVVSFFTLQFSQVFANIPTEPGFDITVFQTDGGGTYFPGDTIEYLITTENIGTTFAKQVFVSETVPALTVINLSASTTGWACSPSNGAPGANCTIQIGNLEPGESKDVVFAVDVDSTLPAEATSTRNQLSVFVGGSGFPETDYTNNNFPIFSTLSSIQDGDNDGIPDQNDNCPSIANADQANYDGDTEGDACDADDDNDGVADGDDGCPLEDGSEYDADSNGCLDRIEDLSAVIESLEIHQGFENSLVTKAEWANRLLDREKKHKARRVLRAFIRHVRAQEGKRISADEADLLIEYAQNVRAQQ